MDLSNLRQNYKLGTLEREQLSANPLKEFEVWLAKAVQSSDNAIEPYAMALATSDRQDRVSVRTVVLRSFTEEGFVFFTNYESLKAKQIEQKLLCGFVFLLVLARAPSKNRGHCN